MNVAAKQAEEAIEVRKIVPARVAHFVIRTRKVRELVAWYKTVFHAEAVFDNGSLAFLHFDSEHHRIAIGEVPDLQESNPKVSGIDHVALSYDGIADLLSTYARLKAVGIEPFLTIDHGPTISLYYRDPDGNQIELQVDNFTTLEETHAYFRSNAFAENPIGVEFDPDALVARLNAGEPSQLLLRPATHPN